MYRKTYLEDRSSLNELSANTAGSPFSVGEEREEPESGDRKHSHARLNESRRNDVWIAEIQVTRNELREKGGGKAKGNNMQSPSLIGDRWVIGRVTGGPHPYTSPPLKKMWVVERKWKSWRK